MLNQDTKIYCNVYIMHIKTPINGHLICQSTPPKNKHLNKITYNIVNTNYRLLLPPFYKCSNITSKFSRVTSSNCHVRRMAVKQPGKPADILSSSSIQRKRLLPSVSTTYLELLGSDYDCRLAVVKQHEWWTWQRRHLPWTAVPTESERRWRRKGGRKEGEVPDGRNPQQGNKLAETITYSDRLGVGVLLAGCRWGPRRGPARPRWMTALSGLN